MELTALKIHIIIYEDYSNKNDNDLITCNRKRIFKNYTKNKDNSSYIDVK